MKEQIDISDGDKGQYAAFQAVFLEANSFLCTNHACGPSGAVTGKGPRNEYFVAAKACTLEDLARLKSKFGDQVKQFAGEYPEKHLFVAAAQSAEAHLHGQTTESGVESQNNSSQSFRRANSPEQVCVCACSPVFVCSAKLGCGSVRLYLSLSGCICLCPCNMSLCGCICF